MIGKPHDLTHSGGLDWQRLSFASQGPSATVHFWVHPQMEEIQQHAAALGWLKSGYTAIQIVWQELHFSTDGWKTTRVLKSTEVPCPVVEGFFQLPFVKPGAAVEFAVQVGISCRAPADTSFERAHSSLWLNNGGGNYLQVAK